MNNINIELGKGINGLLIVLLGVIHVAGLNGRGIDEWVLSLQSGINVGMTIAGFVAVQWWRRHSFPELLGITDKSCILFFLNLLILLVRISGTSSVGSLSWSLVIASSFSDWECFAFVLDLIFLVQPPSFKGMIDSLGDSLEVWGLNLASLNPPWAVHFYLIWFWTSSLSVICIYCISWKYFAEF